MNIFKSHFWYNKSQRNGILFLILLIVVLQLTYAFLDFSSEELHETNTSELLVFQQEIDSLKAIEVESRKPKIYPFNPNFITDFKGKQLGMSLKEIDRLHQFRKQNKYVNSVKEFQQLTKISDSLLQTMVPYFKFPDWLTSKKNRNKKKKLSSIEKAFEEEDFEEISEEKEAIIKLNVNTATFKELLKIPGIDYDLCKKIFEFRDEVAELQDISEIKNIEGFPIEKYERIIVYLTAK
ncbi:ComEA family DNA-binding protein [Tenacibaculum aquimarinum]|uniref:ComEA family DNA-binding protein n=1 Tax=Tenacibaculum aquimarinum TaxID=2910675 RepID=UPI001F0B2AAB|nr:helix-hairpin-helix domain-containing protein [Tenacibaculum aquimarinum]MCH3885742.1 helix-hairpin-helix domain-containing protein [Tenacibaculum aquimarinum]